MIELTLCPRTVHPTQHARQPTLLIVQLQVSLPVIHQLVALFLFAALLGLVHSLSGNPDRESA